jgi:hypothetical protein
MAVNTVERQIGTNDFISIDMTSNLAPGETISGTPTLNPNNAGVSLVVGTVAVSGDGKFISARFLHNSEGYTRVDISCDTTVASVVKKSYFVIKTYVAPS